MLEARIRERDATLSDSEVRERLEIARQEIEEDAKEYDHVIDNEQGKLTDAVERVVEILTKKGYTLNS